MPKLHLTGGDKSVIAGIAVFLSVVTTVGGWLIGEGIEGVTLLLTAVAILVCVLEVYRRLARIQEVSHRRHFEQVESLLSLFFAIKPDYPLPKTRGFAGSPDFLRQVYELTQAETPNLVVEAGSGTSTLITAYSLRRIGRGRVVSLEHDPVFADITRSVISRHGLQDIATVIHAPLKKYDISGQSWLWYDLQPLKLDRPIDFLLIDGPPGSIQRLSRYPAMPLLFRYLSEQATIILDDGQRVDEKEMVARWLRQFGGLSGEFIPLEKGCYVIHRVLNLDGGSQSPAGLKSSSAGINPSSLTPADSALQASNRGEKRVLDIGC